ncbi:putative polyamine aminopropyl transferase [Nymphaea thermarum]|nr:putative polyamine aminopropyl transferase [Nymphaea thermarum]
MLASMDLRCFFTSRPLVRHETSTWNPPSSLHRVTLFFSPLRPLRDRLPQLRVLASTPPPKSLNQQDRRTDDGIPMDYVRTLAKFKSRHNHIRVLEISRRLDHPFAGSRLLLLDRPGNIHSIAFLFKLLTGTYFDVFATFPAILSDGPLAVLGLGAGTAASMILQLYPQAEIHGYEIDPCVVSVGREYFGLSKIEKQHRGRIFIYVGDALRASVREGFSGMIVDLFSKGVVIPELQKPETWVRLRSNLRKGGRVMVNCGGSCVEPEDAARDGASIMEETLKAMDEAFHGQVSVLKLGDRKEDSCLALTGPMPDPVAWKQTLQSSLRHHVDMWRPYRR